MTREEWLLHERLDSARAGERITLTGSAYGYSIHPLPCKDASDYAYSRVCAENPRKKNVYHGKPKIFGNCIQPRWETINYKGSYTAYSGSEVHADYQSCIAIARSRRTAVVIVGNIAKRRVRLPKHYFFGGTQIGRSGGLWTIPATAESLVALRADSIRSLPQLRAAAAKLGAAVDSDANGLRLRIGPDDYHPSPDELRKWDVAGWVARIRTNAETRRRLAAESAAEAAEAADVWVCIADSLRAGNCRAGTEQFAARHGLSTTAHYRAPQLLGIANGDYSRVRLAVKAACIRDRAERERGYAILSEHSVC